MSQLDTRATLPYLPAVQGGLCRPALPSLATRCPRDAHWLGCSPRSGTPACGGTLLRSKFGSASVSCLYHLGAGASAIQMQRHPNKASGFFFFL